jgi:hypothetical protein
MKQASICQELKGQDLKGQDLKPQPGPGRTKNTMRRIFYGLGATAALIIAIGTFGFFVLTRDATALDADSRAYVESSVVAITAHWDTEELWRRSTPQFRAIANHDELRAFLGAAETALGPLVEYRGAQGRARMLIMNFRAIVSANYVANGGFQNGDADLQLSVVKVGDTWMIDGFRISSLALTKRLAGLGI